MPQKTNAKKSPESEAMTIIVTPIVIILVILIFVGVEHWIGVSILVVVSYITLLRKSDQKQNQSGIYTVSASDYESLPKLDAPAGYVYIFKDIEVSQRYKIGRTNHPKRRLNKFGVELPFETAVIHILQTDDAVATEKYLHEQYAPQRKRGEWFDLTDTQLNEIRHLGQSSKQLDETSITSTDASHNNNRYTEPHFLSQVPTDEAVSDQTRATVTDDSIPSYYFTDDRSIEPTFLSPITDDAVISSPVPSVQIPAPHAPQAHYQEYLRQQKLRKRTRFNRNLYLFLLGLILIPFVCSAILVLTSTFR